jgi:hypothetical protein
MTDLFDKNNSIPEEALIVGTASAIKLYDTHPILRKEKPNAKKYAEEIQLLQKDFNFLFQKL